MRFREDINGLRAIAVLPVIFFHAGLNGFEGGFLGVDVFLVISGFLITSSIINNQRKERFSLLDFYDRRARRILPSLVFTLLVTLILAFVFMLPYDLKNFGQSLVATSLGANNILLYFTSGYWSMAADFKPLYHTWSLGIEEQYYFIIPIIFIVLFKKQKLLVSSLILLFLISFYATYTIENKEFNFLIILSRFWELCAGSLLALYMVDNKTTKNDVLSLLGLILISISYYNPYFISENQAFVNLSPVLGTVMVIAFTKPESYIYKSLSVKTITIIGLSSYSIYLLHQPILAFLRLYSEGEVHVYKQLAFSLMAVPLGYLTWRFIESPFREKSIIPNRQFYTLLACFIISFVSIGYFLHQSYGMSEYKFLNKYSYGSNPQVYADRAYGLAKSEFSSESNKKMLIVGNSFARDFYNALEENGATKGYEVIYLYSYDENRELSRKLVRSADLTIFVSSAGMANEINPYAVKESAIAKKKELETYSNGNYYYIGTKNFGFDNNFVRHIDWSNSKDYMVDINESNIYADKIEREVFSDKYISLLDLYRVGNKVRLFTNDHRFISFDTNHITKDGAVYLGETVLQTTKLKKIILQ